MAASIQLDQIGIPASTGPGARTDGVLTGGEVTVTNASGQPCRVEFFWVPPNDTTALTSLAQQSATVWTFDPTVAIAGTYIIHMIEAEGTSDQTEDTKDFGIRTASKGLLIPGLNEKGDPTVTLASTATEKAQAASISYNNETNPEGLDYLAWWQSQRELYDAVEAGAGGATTFIALTDTPGTFAGQAGLVATVNPGETALIFSPAAGGEDLETVLGNGNVTGGENIVLSSGTLVFSPAGTAGGSGIPINMLAGDGSGTGGDGGDFNITAGEGIASNGSGGAIQFTTGGGGASDGFSGNFDLRVGARQGTGTNGTFNFTVLGTGVQALVIGDQTDFTGAAEGDALLKGASGQSEWGNFKLAPDITNSGSVADAGTLSVTSVALASGEDVQLQITVATRTGTTIDRVRALVRASRQGASTSVLEPVEILSDFVDVNFTLTAVLVGEAIRVDFNNDTGGATANSIIRLTSDKILSTP